MAVGYLVSGGLVVAIGIMGTLSARGSLRAKMGIVALLGLVGFGAGSLLVGSALMERSGQLFFAGRTLQTLAGIVLVAGLLARRPRGR